MIFARPQWLLGLLALLPYALAARLFLARLPRLAALVFAGGHDPGSPADRAWQVYLSRRRLGSLAGAAFLVCACLALADPSFRRHTVMLPVRDAEVAFVLDVSNSMLSVDETLSRLELARRLVDRIADSRPDCRHSLTVFKGDALLLTPATSSRPAFMENLAWATPSLMSMRGSNLSAALASLAVPPAAGLARVVVVLTDGQFTGGEVRDVAVRVGQGSSGFVLVGLGGDEARPVQTINGQAVLDDRQRIIALAQNRGALADLAELAAALYVDAGREAALGAAAGQVIGYLQARLPRPGQTRPVTAAVSSASLFMWLTVLAFWAVIWCGRPYRRPEIGEGH